MVDDEGVQLYQYVLLFVWIWLVDGIVVVFDVLIGYFVDGWVWIMVQEDVWFMLIFCVFGWVEGVLVWVLLGDGEFFEFVCFGVVFVWWLYWVGDIVEFELLIVFCVILLYLMVDVVCGSVVIECGFEVLVLEFIDLGVDVGEVVVVGDLIDWDGVVVLLVCSWLIGEVVEVLFVVYYDWV